MRILDCTLRDGGYYTNWDFDDALVDKYIEAVNVLPVDYIEVGYRNNPGKEYIGKFGYTPAYILKHIRSRCRKKVAVMLNEKSTLPGDLDRLLRPICGLADMVRLAVDPKNIDRAIVLAEAVKGLGFEVGFNMMYMSRWHEMDGFFPKLRGLRGVVDMLCIVDSFGGVTPDDVKSTLAEVRKYTGVPLAFHGHDNLQMGLINAITAMDNGIDSVDATISGMGRGAGNLKTELLLTYLNHRTGLDVDFNVLGDVIASFKPLMDKYRWGTSLPYMLSGANNIPQKEVMEWVTNRVYSFNSIVRALANRKSGVADNARFPLFEAKEKYERVIVIGGGDSATTHATAIKDFVAGNARTALVFATARQAQAYNDFPATKFYCLGGSEGHRLTANVGRDNYKGICILPPYPRTMGTDVPEYAIGSTYELKSISFTDSFKDSVTTLALQLALLLTDGDIFVTGYDGYPDNVLSEKEVTLTNENKAIFDAYAKVKGAPLKSLTYSIYKELDIQSVYQFI